MSTSVSDFSQKIIEEFRANGGVVGGRWYHNLKAHPEVTIEVGTQTLPAVAVEADPAERERLYNAQAQDSPQFADYQRNTKRTIPVIILTPTGEGGS